jgi:hypothetical protein
LFPVFIYSSLFSDTTALTRSQVALDTIDVDVYEQREGLSLHKEAGVVEIRRGGKSTCGLNLRLDLRHPSEFDFE